MTTTDYAGLADELDAHMGKQEVPILLRDCRRAAAAIRTLLERNAALERERTNLIETKREQIDRLNTRVAELEKALEPFAREAEDWSPEANGGHAFDDAESIAGETSIKVGHLRTARSLVKGGGE